MNRRTTRKLFLVLAIVLTCLTIAPRFTPDGYLVPIRVDGASMAPTLSGKHHKVTCKSCDFPFLVSDIAPVRSNRIQCPNCGEVASEWPASAPRQGDRILVQEFSLHRGQPQRWQVVTVEREHGKRVVKRVVGLPGEQVSIWDGDLYINQQIAIRPTELSDSMSIVVNDDRFRRMHAGMEISKWRPETSSAWAKTPSGFSVHSVDSSDVNWMRYRHTRPSESDPVAAMGPGITDDCAINQGVARRLHMVVDLSLSGDLEVSGEGSLWIQQVVRAETWNWELNFSNGTATLSSPSQQVESAPLTFRRFRFKVESIDRMFRLWINERLVISHVTGTAASDSLWADREAPSWHPTVAVHDRGDSSPFSLGAIGIELTVSRLLVTRDSYVTSEPRSANHSWILADDEYFLLGDNFPVSEDSRHWDEPARRNQLLGLARKHPLFARMLDSPDSHSGK